MVAVIPPLRELYGHPVLYKPGSGTDIFLENEYIVGFGSLNLCMDSVANNCLPLPFSTQGTLRDSFCTAKLTVWCHKVDIFMYWWYWVSPYTGIQLQGVVEGYGALRMLPISLFLPFLFFRYSTIAPILNPYTINYLSIQSASERSCWGSTCLNRYILKTKCLEY